MYKKSYQTSKAKEVVQQMRIDRQTAAEYILNFAEYQKQYNKAKKDKLTMSKEYYQTGKDKHPVETAVIRSMKYDTNSPMFAWLQAVKITLQTYGERKRIFIEVRQRAEEQRKRFGKRQHNSWVLYVQKHYAEEIEARFIGCDGWLGERTIQSWWQQILDRTVEVHLRIANNAEKK